MCEFSLEYIDGEILHLGSHTNGCFKQIDAYEHPSKQETTLNLKTHFVHVDSYIDRLIISLCTNVMLSCSFEISSMSSHRKVCCNISRNMVMTHLLKKYIQ